METLVPLLRALADESRLRVVRLLLHEEALNVGELQRILGLAQSTVSKQLQELRRAGVVRERREAGFSFYELERRPGEPWFELLRAELGGGGASGDGEGDLARLAEVLRERRDRGEEGGGKLVEPGRSWVAWARALRFVLPPLRVADLGCGDGALTVEIASWAASVVAVEKSAARLARARERAARAGLENVTFVHGDIETAALRPGTVDLVLASHVLHHVARPAAVLRRAHGLLVKGGRALVLELAPHQEAWVREKLGHVHMGFAPQALEKALLEAGFARTLVEGAPGKAAREPFRILIATGVRP